MTALAAIATLSELNAYQLAGMADVTSPDSLESAGAHFLTHIRDDVAERLEWLASGDYADVTEPAEFVSIIRDLDDWAYEIADGAPSIYTHEKFQQFFDLCAYQEDISELAPDETDMEKMAGIALYMIAERLVSALLDTVEEFEPAETEGN